MHIEVQFLSDRLIKTLNKKYMDKKKVEEWKDIVGYENRYKISTLGRVYLKTKDRVCNLRNHNKGYKYISLYGNDKSEKRFLVHRLVAMAFIENSSIDRNCVNHKDGVKTNNSVDNLEWCTRSENNKHASETNLVSNGSSRWNSKLDDLKIKSIREIYSNGVYQRVIAEKFNITQGQVSMIVNNKNWKQVK
jgi:hypothetical protein